MLSGNMPFVPFTAAAILNSYCTVINSVFKELAEGLNVCSGKCFCYVIVFHFLFESRSDVFICIFPSSQHRESLIQPLCVYLRRVAFLFPLLITEMTFY